jgi:glucokinase-like ROK family protein
LLEESGVGESARGRKQVLLKLSSEHGIVVGVDFDVNRVIGLAVDLTSRVVGRSRTVLAAGAGREAILEAIRQTIRDVMDEAGCNGDKLVGIGIGDPGLIDSRKGISIFSSTVSDWRNVPLKAILEGTFHVPVTMEGSTRSKTLCEKRFGEGREAENFLFIEYGTGIGCGLMLNGKLFRGKTESAGELGHVRVLENGPVCTCGSYGCLETVASLPALASQAVRAIREGARSKILDMAEGDLKKVTGEHVFEAAKHGDKLALGILDKAAEYLGIGIAAAINLFNPEMVIFDSRLGKASELMLEPAMKVIQRQALAVATRGLKLEVSKMGEEAGALGAAVLVLDQMFEIPQLEVPEFMAR